MAKVKPFKGYRYNNLKIPELNQVMAPPYDSISDEEQAALYKKHDNNIVRLAFGMNFPKDDSKNNKYTRSAITLNKWIDEQILVQEDKPAIYMYEQIVPINEVQTHSSTGFVGLLKLEEFDSETILPCEDSVYLAKNDRFNLLASTNANFGMINCVYSDQEKTLSSIISEVSETDPDMTVTTDNGIIHRLWAITYEPTIEKIQTALLDKPMVIADGQNRYEACLDFSKIMKNSNPNHSEDAGYNYIMALFSNVSSDGMMQLPVHRLVTTPKKLKEEYIIAGAQDHFKVEKIIVDTDMDELVDTMRKQIATQRKENKIAFYCGGNYFYRFTLIDYDYLKTRIPDKSEAFRTLDVTVLNELVLSELFNINEDNYYERVTYTKEYKEAVQSVQKGEYSCLFMINPTKAYQINEIAKHGEKMPERSICIFPKPATGILTYKF